MAKAKAKPYPPALLELMAAKTGLLMKARYQAALAGPLRPNTRRDVEAMLAGCLDELHRMAGNGSSRRGGPVPAGT
jgi:hypothetical protein